MPRLGQDLVRLAGGGAVGGLDHDLGLDPRRVLRGDLPLQRRRDEDVAVELERVLAPGQVGGSREVEQAPPLPPVRHDLLEVEPLRVGDGALGFGQTHQDRAALLEELGGEVADVAQPLDHDPLARRVPVDRPSAFMSSATPQTSRVP